MKKLILARHAKTEPLSDAGTDFERKLKKRGITDAGLVAVDLKRRGYIPELIISSPARRAMQTAKIYAANFGIPEEDIVVAGIIYDGDTTERMIAAITELARDTSTLMVVGHNPDMARLSMLLSSQEFYHYPTSAVTVISFPVMTWQEVEVGRGKADYFTYPRMLKDLGTL